MITREETEELLERLKQTRSKKLFDYFNVDDAGIIHVMKILIRSDRLLSAGEISSEMNVSTARVAVLLKKMEQKGLIVRTTDNTDGRKTLIGVSEEGKKENQRRDERALAFAAAVIDRVGIERFTEFIEISGEIKKIVDEEIDLCMEKHGNDEGYDD